MQNEKNVTATIGHFIDGKHVLDTARTQPVFDPATGLSHKSVALASKATVEQAIASAQAAFPAWRNTPPLKRARVMSRLKILLEENADQIAALITAEHGKVLSDAHGEVQRGIENVEYASYAPELLKGEHSRNVGPVHRHVERVPGAGRVRGHHALQLSRRWCRCGCGPWPWPAATPLSSSPRSATRRRCC